MKRAWIAGHTQWIVKNWDWSKLKPVIRCAVVAWVTVVLFVTFVVFAVKLVAGHHVIAPATVAGPDLAEIVDHALHPPELWGERHVAFSARPAGLGKHEDRPQGFKFLLLNHFPAPSTTTLAPGAPPLETRAPSSCS